MDVKDKNRNKKKRKRKGVKPRRKVVIKHRLKDLTEVEGKSKLKKSLARNKLILQILENKKNSHHGQTPKIGDDELFIYKGLNKKERKAIHENLELLKERLLYKLSANDVNFQKKLGMYKKQAVKDFNKIKSGKYHDAKTEEYKENKDENRNNQDSSPVEKVKRSVFGEKPEDFGNYKPLTPGIKEWKPSDILTLGKDMNLDSASNLKPDFEAFRNVITPNRYSNLRRKRKSIDNDISYTDTVSYMNDIGRDSVPYVVPNVKTESSDYKRRISTQYMNKVEPEPLESKGATVTIHNNKEVDDLIATASNFSTVINRLSDNIQKIPTKEEQSIIDNFINKISVFFMNIGKALGFY